jgi:integrase
MANKTTPLTNTEVKQAKPKAKEYNLSDGGGLALRIKPSGSKLWIFNYSRPHTKKRANLGLGKYPDLTLAEARRKSEEYRSLLTQDIDPKLHRDKQQLEELAATSLTLEKVVNSWFEIKRTTITPNYADDIIRSLNNHILPTLGSYSLHQITAPIVINSLKPLSNSGKLEAVKRISQRLNEVMTFAVNTGLIDNNPLSGIRHAFETPTVTNNPTLKPEQLPELMSALSKASIRNITKILIHWQLHTMTRPSETAGARWNEIDIANGLWVIPKERMKKRREHCIPLSPQMLTLLDELRPISSKSTYLFPSDINPNKCANSATANMALKRMGFKGRLTSHGMRALASTTLNEHGFDPDVIEAALAHVDKNAVRGAYNRAQYLERRSVMMTWWGERIEQAATGEDSQINSTKVLQMIG